MWRSTTTRWDRRSWSWSAGCSARDSRGCGGWPGSTSPPGSSARGTASGRSPRRWPRRRERPPGWPPNGREAAMTEALLAGGVLGLGLFLLMRALFPARPGLAARLLQLDAAGQRENATPRLLLQEEELSAF